MNISYNIGDNRSYFLRLHLDIINISLYKKENIDFQVNHNINPNYYLELVRSLRKMFGYPLEKREYYSFGDVNKIFSRSRVSRIRNKKTKKQNKRKKKSQKAGAYSTLTRLHTITENPEGESCGYAYDALILQMKNSKYEENLTYDEKFKEYNENIRGYREEIKIIESSMADSDSESERIEKNLEIDLKKLEIKSLKIEKSKILKFICEDWRRWKNENGEHYNPPINPIDCGICVKRNGGFYDINNI